MMKIISIVGVVIVLAQCGCRPHEGPGNTSIGNEYVATTEPAQAIPVGQAAATAQAGDVVTISGFIGGSKEPFLKGVVVFTIVDPKVPYCAAEEGCPTPWDYCCQQEQVRSNIMTIKFVDRNGRLLEGDARQLLGVKPLNLVVVSGTVERDDAGNVALLAKQVYVKK